MATLATSFDYAVTEDKVYEAVRRIIVAADPIKVIAFGSRARGDFRPDSDLDLAVIVEQPLKDGERVVSSRTLEGIRMSVDLLLFNPQDHEDYKPWINSVHYDIDHEGVILYERSKDQSPDRTAIEKIVRG